jgi:putative transposase
MPYRKIAISTDEVYHLFNRGIGKMPIFTSKHEYLRFLELVEYYRFNGGMSYSHFNRLSNEDKTAYLKERNIDSNKQVIVYVYCLMPNHFHILLKQLIDNGITQMLSNVQNGYAKYFNLRHDRKGTLFESMFNIVRIESDEQLLHVSRYIHLNPATSFVTRLNELKKYTWSSFSDYLGTDSRDFLDTGLILELSGGRSKYRKFVFNQASYQRELNRIKHLTLES